MLSYVHFFKLKASLSLRNNFLILCKGIMSSSSELDPKLLSILLRSLMDSIRDKKLDVSSAFNIIVKSMELLHSFHAFQHLNGNDKKQYLLAAVTEIAKGEDGISGTADDLIPAHIVTALRILVDGDFVGDIVEIIIDASRGKFDLNKVEKTCVKCFAFQRRLK